MTREQKYAEQLRAIGLYQPAFDPEIHTLAMMERELQRLNKAWKADGSPVEDSDLYAAIVTLRRDILSHRDALGLTPKGLHRLRPKGLDAENTQTPQLSVLDQLRAKRAEA